MSIYIIRIKINTFLENKLSGPYGHLDSNNTNGYVDFKAKSFHVSHCYKRIHQTRNSENGTNKKKKQNLKRELNSDFQI